MHFCYILYSSKLNRYYTGETPDVAARLLYHNSPELNTNSTKAGIPWEIKLIIPCEDRSQALKVERHIKRMKSKRFIESLIEYPELVHKIVTVNH
jgi:putative endonuclease